MIYVVIGTLAIVAAGVIIACMLEYRRVKREKAKIREEFKIDISEWNP